MGDILKNSDFEFYIQDQQPGVREGYSPVKNKKKSPKNNPAAPAKSPNHQPQKRSERYDGIRPPSLRQLRGLGRENLPSLSQYASSSRQTVCQQDLSGVFKRNGGCKEVHLRGAEPTRHLDHGPSAAAVPRIVDGEGGPPSRQVLEWIPFRVQKHHRKVRAGCGQPGHVTKAQAARWSTGLRAQQGKLSNVT